MEEVLEGLPDGAYVLDLGSGSGSFPAKLYPVVTIRLDLEMRSSTPGDNLIIADAAALPLAASSFHAVVANHSLEHFHNLNRVLEEIRRVLRPSARLYVSVPNSSTITDRIYRWIASGGGHINVFNSERDVINVVERIAHVRHVGTRRLISSLNFLNRKKVKGWPRRKIYPLGGGDERFLGLLVFALRLLDRWFGSPLSHYGWAFYFGSFSKPIDSRVRTNVCVRCGAGHACSWLLTNGLVRHNFLLPAKYLCPQCGASNWFTRDET